MMGLVRRSEAKIHPVLDASLFIRTICCALGLTPQEIMFNIQLAVSNEALLIAN